MVAEVAGNLDFVIAAAASGLRPERVEEYSVANAIGLYRMPRGERADAEAFVRELVQVAYRGKDRTTLDAMTRRYQGRSWFFEPPPPSDYYWSFSRGIAGYRPLGHWKKVRARVLLVYGRYDERVPADESLARIRDTLAEAGHDRVFRHWIIPEADHNFRLVGGAQYGTWPKRVPEFAKRLINWVLWDHGNEGAPEY
jgi:pimeloyl-ACP methyl ester carboxylesterase